MKSFAAIFAALGFVATSAFAETAVKTEYFHQAPMDKNEGTGGLSYSDSSTENKRNTGYGKYKKTLTPLTLKYERGLSDMFSVGAELAYLLGGSGDVSGTVAGDKYDIKGMSDLVIYMRGQHGLMSNLSLNFGLDLNYALGKAKTKTTAAAVNTEGQTETTLQSGGMGLAPYVGVAYVMDSHIFGAKLSTEMGLGDRKLDIETKATTTTTTTTSYKDSGMYTTKLAAFYETAAMGAILGAELSYSGTSTLKRKLDVAPNTETKTAQQNMMGLNFYAAYDLNETTTLLGNLSYDWSASDTEDYGSTKVMGLGVAGRFTF